MSTIGLWVVVKITAIRLGRMRLSLEPPLRATCDPVPRAFDRPWSGWRPAKA